MHCASDSLGSVCLVADIGIIAGAVFILFPNTALRRLKPQPSVFNFGFIRNLEQNQQAKVLLAA